MTITKAVNSKNFNHDFLIDSIFQILMDYIIVNGLLLLDHFVIKFIKHHYEC